MKAYFFIHGTSQDSASDRETTVMMANQARSEGHIVRELGGPGSVELAIRRTNRLAPTSFHDIELPTDILTEYGGGIVMGTGVKDIIEWFIDEFMTIKGRVDEIYVCGFSRGAVAAALAIERIGKILTGNTKIKLNIPVSLVLLDPVPGPLFVPKVVTIPTFAKSVTLINSKHEGRLGFQHLGISLTGNQEFHGGLCIGGHGDIGGSSQSPISKIVRAYTLNRLKLQNPNPLNAVDQGRIALDVLFDQSPYIDSYKWTTRQFNDGEQLWHPSERGDLETPCTMAHESLQNNPLFRGLLSPTEPSVDTELFDMELHKNPRLVKPVEQFIKRRRKSAINLMLNFPPRLNSQGNIVIPPPYIQRLLPWKHGAFKYTPRLLKFARK